MTASKAEISAGSVSAGKPAVCVNNCRSVTRCICGSMRLAMPGKSCASVSSKLN
jgi:hypothetical protein